MDYSKPWIFEEIGKGREEAYFLQKEAELIENLRRKFHEEQDRERLAEEVEIHDTRILNALEAHLATCCWTSCSIRVPMTALSTFAGA